MSKPKQLALLGILVALILWLASAPTPAYAHATPVRTDPVDGVTLSKAPQQIRIWFDEPFVSDFSRLELVDNEGKHFAALNIHSETDSSGQSVLVATLPELAPNAYRANWQTRSADDLHIIQGTIIFGIQYAVTGQTGSTLTPSTQPLEVMLRWFTFVGLGVLAGIAAIARRRDVELARRLVRLALFATGLLLLAQFGLILYQGWPDGSLWQILSSTAYGVRWWISQVILLILFVRFLTQSSKSSFLPLYIILLPLVVVQALNGHSAPGRGVWYFLNTGIDSLHLLSASLWAGGLLVLMVIIVPLLRPGFNQTSLAWEILGHFGKLAFFSLVALVATGLYKSGQQVASLDGLLTSLYGQVLLSKVELVLLLALLGLLNTAILHPGIARRLAWLLRRPANWRLLSPRYLPRIVLAETIGLSLVLLLTAFLTSSQPPRGPEYEPLLAENVAPIVSQQANDIVFSLSVKPNRPGRNFLSLSVLNTRRPAPAPIEAVVVQLRSLEVEGSDVTLNAETLGSGRYQVAGNYFKSAGKWEVEVTVNRPGLPQTKLIVPWQVLPTEANRRPVVFSNEPLAPWLSLVAIVVAVLGLVIWLQFQFRFRFLSRRPAIIKSL